MVMVNGTAPVDGNPRSWRQGKADQDDTARVSAPWLVSLAVLARFHAAVVALRRSMPVEKITVGTGRTIRNTVFKEPVFSGSLFGQTPINR